MTLWIMSIIIFMWALNMLVEILNISSMNLPVPPSLEGSVNSADYKITQSYLKQTTLVKLSQESLESFLVLVLILSGGLNSLDLYLRGWIDSPLLIGMSFLGILTLAYYIIGIPFTLYKTFVTEERFGFNRTSLTTFLFDQLKVGLLSLSIGLPILALILWLLSGNNTYMWLIAWGALTIIQLLLTYIAPTYLMPLFNRFEPLEKGSLRSKIEAYAKKQNFPLKEIFVMDGSKRSKKSNAFFTGFGKQRRIVFYDTLLQELSEEEVIAVLAHEMGHFKRLHIVKILTLGMIKSAFIFYLLGWMINSPSLSQFFLMSNPSVHASIYFCTILLAPLQLILSLVSSYLSRKYEFEADAYAVNTLQEPHTLCQALKKLHIENRAHLNPHPIKVLIEYSHPPLTQRLRQITL